MASQVVLYRHNLVDLAYRLESATPQTLGQHVPTVHHSLISGNFAAGTFLC